MTMKIFKNLFQKQFALKQHQDIYIFVKWESVIAV